MSDVLPTIRIRAICIIRKLNTYLIYCIQVNWFIIIIVPLCSPKNTNLNFLRGLPKSPEDDILIEIILISI